MGDYLRTTHTCTLASMRPELVAVIRTHIQKYELGNLEPLVMWCCETTSTKQKRGLFGGKPEIIHTGVLLTAEWLIWAAGTIPGPIGVKSARLRDIQVLDYEQSTDYKLIPDAGVVIHGRYTNAESVSSSFIGLGPEPSAVQFRSALRDAMR